MSGFPERGGFGAVPSPHDSRDFRAATFVPRGGAVVAETQTIETLMQPVRNQGPVGTCAAFTLAGAAGYFQNTSPAKPGGAPDFEVISPTWIYTKGRLQNPLFYNGIQGLCLKDGLRVMRNVGMATEKRIPYDPMNLAIPEGISLAEVSENLIQTYARVAMDPQSIMQAAHYFGPLPMAMTLTEAIYKASAADEVISIRPGEAPPLEGHAMAIVGWCQKRRAWRVRNSWGADFGKGGYFWLSWDSPLWEVWSLTPSIGGQPPQQGFLLWLQDLLAGRL